MGFPTKICMMVEKSAKNQTTKLKKLAPLTIQPHFPDDQRCFPLLHGTLSAALQKEHTLHLFNFPFFEPNKPYMRQTVWPTVVPVSWVNKCQPAAGPHGYSTACLNSSGVENDGESSATFFFFFDIVLCIWKQTFFEAPQKWITLERMLLPNRLCLHEAVCVSVTVVMCVTVSCVLFTPCVNAPLHVCVRFVDSTLLVMVHL